MTFGNIYIYTYISWGGLCAIVRNSGKGIKAIFMQSSISGTSILTQRLQSRFTVKLCKVFSGLLEFGYCSFR